MYKIIGQDGKEYGPVTAAQLRQWIAESRVESRTPVFADGAKDWIFVGLLPEFAGQFPASSPQIPPPITHPNQPRKNNSFAMTGFICGIVSMPFVICCCGGFPFNILGLIFSIIALAQINESPKLHKGRGLAIAGLILSVVSFLFMTIEMVTGHWQISSNAIQFQ